MALIKKMIKLQPSYLI